MKKIIISLFSITVSVLFGTSYAQVYKAGDLNVQKNIAKLNLLPLTTGTFAFEYERAIAQKFSLGAMLSYRPSNLTVPFFTVWGEWMASGNEDLYTALKKAKEGAFSGAIEGRFYPMQRGLMRGFYIAPYVKYAQYDLSFPFKISLDLSELEYNTIDNVDTRGDLSILTAGVGVGFQFKIWENIRLDWRVAAVGYGSAKGDLTGRAERKLNPEEQQYLREQLDDLGDFSLIEEKIVNEDGVFIKANGGWTGVRTALSVGYQF
ncbi:DUF3575 domain-containing protein [Sphingobacterium sp. LRF_L2]|uniref:DUF3575 domain-containing protein n=1 Tax=Sphingobacterium sp. LRF_L2 TaxID=3369421 RepID=UPI003F63C758